MGKDGDEGASKGEVKRGSLGNRRWMVMIQRMESFGIYDSLAPLAIWIPIIFCIIRQSLGYQGSFDWELGGYKERRGNSEETQDYGGSL